MGKATKKVWFCGRILQQNERVQNREEIRILRLYRINCAMALHVRTMAKKLDISWVTHA